METQDRSEIRQHLKVWSKWRRTGRLGQGLYWPRVSITGRFLDGMKGDTCPSCKGHKKLPGHVYEIDEVWVECQRCNGTGRVKLNNKDSRINPAFIRESYRGNIDPIMLEIDRAMCDLKRDHKKVRIWYAIWSEYNYNGTQRQKAFKKQLTYKQYRISLEKGHEFIYDRIKNLNQRAKYA